MEFALRDSKRMRSSSPKNPIRLNKIPLLDSCKVGVFLWLATCFVCTHFILKRGRARPAAVFAVFSQWCFSSRARRIEHVHFIIIEVSFGKRQQLILYPALHQQSSEN